MARQKRITTKPIICVAIMVLFLLTGMDDISGVWQQLNVCATMIQSGDGHDDGQDRAVKSLNKHASWKDGIDVSQQFCFSQAYLEEVKCQVTLHDINSFHDRAPPSFS
jgi:hypothetical protein